MCQGKYINLIAGGKAKDQNENVFRFGFEFDYGLAFRPGLSNANKNAFTVNGTLYKLHTMEIVKGYHPNQHEEIRSIHIKMK